VEDIRENRGDIMKSNVFTAKISRKEVDNVEETIEIIIGNMPIEVFTMEDQRFLEEECFYKIQLLPQIFDEIVINKIDKPLKEIMRVEKSISYYLKGLYYADEQIIDVGFKLDLSEHELHDFSFLDKKYIQIFISRFDLEVISN